MAATFGTGNLVLTTSLGDLMAAPAAGKVRTVAVRFCNVGAADAYGDLVMTNGVTTINRAKNYPVLYEAPGSAPDIEQTLTVPAGYKLQAKASASSAVEASYTYTEADTTDFS